MLTKITIAEFCYWLQGAIEIGDLDRITPEQAQLIHNRLAQLERQNYFTASVKTIIEHYPLDSGFSAISEELQRMFKHHIDPSYEGDQEFFLGVHEGKSANEKP
jgi:hypothetical protein